MKKIIYHASAYRSIHEFPEKAKQRMMRLLEMVSEGLDLQPKDFKYMPSVGMGTYELRVKTDNQYRIFYVTKFPEAIYVLHAFLKKTQTTSKKDLDKGKEQYKKILEQKNKGYII
jgi:phage-related protein